METTVLDPTAEPPPYSPYEAQSASPSQMERLQASDRDLSRAQISFITEDHSSAQTFWNLCGTIVVDSDTPLTAMFRSSHTYETFTPVQSQDLQEEQQHAERAWQEQSASTRVRKRARARHIMQRIMLPGRKTYQTMIQQANVQLRRRKSRRRLRRRLRYIAKNLNPLICWGVIIGVIGMAILCFSSK